MQVRQSDLGSAQRCFYQKHLGDLEAEGGVQGETNSQTVMGSVAHYALQIGQQLFYQGREDAAEVAVATFEHYWKPENVTEIEPKGIGFWLPRQTYGGLLIRGRKAIRDYFDLLKSDNGTALALEYEWQVPYELDGEMHQLRGTADRLVLRLHKNKPYLSVEDFKTGKRPKYLRFSTQFTVYSYASTRPEFWIAFGELIQPLVTKLHKKKLALWDDGSGFEVIARRGRWINIGQENTVSVHDAGWRTEHDYARMQVQIRHYINAHKAQVFPLTLSGETCFYCRYSRNGACGGVPIPELESGAPE